MASYDNQQALVIGLGLSGVAAATLLRARGGRVLGVDTADTPALRETSARLAALGVEVRLGASHAPEGRFDLAVLSPGVPADLPLLAEVRALGIPILGELELGYRESLCLNVAITGTDGKTTTTRLIEAVLRNSHRKTVAAGNVGTPLCSVVDQTRDLDLLTLEVSSFQLEAIEYFRPTIAVVMNIAPDHLDRHGTMEAYVRAKGQIFRNQQPFDWAVLQSGALERFRAAGVEIPGKLVTFSATDPGADLHLDRGLLISRLPGWEGPLLDIDQCRLSGPHNAENCMAALAVGRILRRRWRRRLRR